MNAKPSPTAAKALAVLTAVATRVSVLNLDAAAVAHTFFMADNEVITLVLSRRAGRLLRGSAQVAEGVIRYTGRQKDIAFEARLFATWHTFRPATAAA